MIVLGETPHGALERHRIVRRERAPVYPPANPEEPVGSLFSGQFNADIWLGSFWYHNGRGGI